MKASNVKPESQLARPFFKMKNNVFCEQIDLRNLLINVKTHQYFDQISMVISKNWAEGGVKVTQRSLAAGPGDGVQPIGCRERNKIVKMVTGAPRNWLLVQAWWLRVGGTILPKWFWHIV